MTTFSTVIMPATIDHLEILLTIEKQCFTADRLSRRSMRRFLTNEQSVFLLAMHESVCMGYILIVFHRGTRLARMYSLAVSPEFRGHGVAHQLVVSGESEAKHRGALYFRLEVNNANTSAIKLYESLGFKTFALLHDYYEDHSDAFRMQKRIRYPEQSSVKTSIPWYQQNTPFTCGPASLMMAMHGLDPHYPAGISEELDIWREATTIFMTSGHGGCHPFGLALAAKKRGFNVEVWLNQTQPLFVDGVRSADKKSIIEIVHNDFEKQMALENITIHYQDINQEILTKASDDGAVPIVLISTYRMDKKKTPHWVVVSGFDDQCLYMHDPDTDDDQKDFLDCQYLPIAKADFAPMSVFGSNKLRTAVIISKKE